MNEQQIKTMLITSVKNSTGYPFDESMFDGIAKFIASGGNDITRISLTDIVANAFDKLHSNLIER